MSKGRPYAVKRCAHCGKAMHGSRKRLYCNRACQQRAYRARRDSARETSH